MINEQDDSFSFIRQNCTESKMFRNAYLEQLTLRDVVDSVFLNMLTLYLLSKEFETAPFAQDYAHKTIMYGTFDSPKTGGTDLYQGIYLVLNPTSPTGELLRGKEQNAALASEIHATAKLFKDYLRRLATGTMDHVTATRIMYQLEGKLDIDISNYKSLRRLITDWDNISTYQRQLCVTRMLQYYRVRGRRSELFPVLETLTDKKGWELTAAGNAELQDVGAGAIAGSRSGHGFLSSIASVAAGALAGHLAWKAINGSNK
jgi:hypothetical protein